MFNTYIRKDVFMVIDFIKLNLYNWELFLESFNNGY